MSLTVTREYASLGSKQAAIGEITFDSSYPTGVEPFNALSLLGINNVDSMVIENKSGYVFEFDKTNKKVKVMQQRYMPPIVYEEHHVMDTSYQVQLDYPAAYIMNVAKKLQSIPMRSTGVTPGAFQCALVSQMADGVAPTLLFNSSLNVNDSLFVNGTFTTDSTGWTGTNLGPWTFAGNALAKDGAGTETAVEDAFVPVVGHTYELTYTITAVTAATGGVTPSLGGVTGTNRTTTGTFTERFLATAATGFAFTPGNTAFRGIIDNAYLIDCDVYVTYVTQAWRDVWDNLVQDESITFATGDNNLASGNKIAAVMYIDQITATATRIIPIDEDDTVGSGEAEVAFNSATNVLKVHSDQNAHAAKITYIKVPSSGFLKDRLFHNEGATKAGGDPYTNTFDYPILLWGYSGTVPINGAANLGIIRYMDTPATTEAVVDWFGLGARGAGAPAVGTEVGVKDNVTATGAGIWGRIHEIPAVSTLAEVPSATDLSGITVRYMAIGI
jgi:hypothetical protein